MEADASVPSVTVSFTDAATTGRQNTIVATIVTNGLTCAEGGQQPYTVNPITFDAMTVSVTHQASGIWYFWVQHLFVMKFCSRISVCIYFLFSLLFCAFVAAIQCTELGNGHFKIAQLHLSISHFSICRSCIWHLCIFSFCFSLDLDIQTTNISPSIALALALVAFEH